MTTGRKPPHYPDPNTALGRAWIALLNEVAERTARRGDGRSPELAYVAISGPNVHVFARPHDLANGRVVTGDVGDHVSALTWDAEKGAFVTADGAAPGLVLFNALWALEAHLLKQREDARRKKR